MQKTSLFFDHRDSAVPVVTVVSRQAKTVKLAYDATSGSVRITVPSSRYRINAEELVRAHASWIAVHIDRDIAVVQETHELGFPFLGRRRFFDIRSGARKTFWLDHDVATITGPAGQRGRYFHKLSSNCLRDTLLCTAHSDAEKLGVTIDGVNVKYLRSRWGSCRRDGQLTFSWFLLFAPAEIVRYVVAHEVSHRRHMDHSTSFWDTVAMLCPDYVKARKWLRDYGTTLWILGRTALKHVELADNS